MTSANSSRKQFRAMFLRSLPVASVFPLILFVERMIYSFSHSKYDYTAYKIGFFWDLDRYFSAFSPLFFDSFSLAVIAFITAVMIFSYTWSKKQCNVVLSLGMKRSDIYLSKLLAGIVPFVAAVILSAGFEVFACAACGYKLSARYLVIVIKTVLNIIAPYVMSFSVFSLVLSNVGSSIEGSVFSLLFITAPGNIHNIINDLFDAYTLGSPSTESWDSPVWNWYKPLECYTFDDQYIYGNYAESGEAYIFSVHSNASFSIFDWSAIIMCFIYASVAAVIGMYAYKHKKNEIAGTFGRARALTEVSAVLAALIGFFWFNLTISSDSSYNAPAEPYFLGFICGCIAFIIVYVVFKMIFGYKRKKEFIGSLKRIPAYIGGLAVCMLVFYFGLFGYSSRVPSVEKIERVEVSTPMFAYLDDALSDGTYYVMKYMNIRDELNQAMTYDDDTYYMESHSIPADPINYYNPYTAYFKTENDIQKAVQLHKSFVDAGHVSGNGKDTYGTKIRFNYILKDGRTVTRDYHRADEETIKKVLLLSDCEAVKDIQSLNWNYNAGQQALTQNYHSSPEYDDTDIISDPFYENKIGYRYAYDCYLFTKDMKRGFSIGQADVELLTAIAEDIRTQSANEHFYHSPEDEIGVISFGLSEQHSTVPENDSEIADYDEYGLRSTTWNLNSYDIKTVVLTKDMTNTVKYLEDNGYMKYFDRNSTSEDISYVKIESMRTLYGQKYAYKNIPIFYGAYTRKRPVYLWGDNPSGVPEYGYGEYYDTYNDGYAGKNPFNSVEPIQDKTQIQALLDDSMLFGFCSNDCYIMNIYYTDDTSGTVFIPAGSPSLQTLN